MNLTLQLLLLPMYGIIDDNEKPTKIQLLIEVTTKLPHDIL